jgi:hypothetical protein
VRRLAAGALLLVSPLLLAAARDPSGDVAACGGSASGPVSGPDLVAVEAYADELDTAAVWRLRFAAPIPVPDRVGSPIRIDILVRDPLLPAVSRGDERGMNRLVRWVDTGADAPVDVAWLADGGHTPFNPPVIDGRTIEVRVPGRILLGEAANGAESVTRARWSVLVRDGNACDRLGGRPMMRLREPTPSPTGATTPLGGTPAAGGTASDTPNRGAGGFALVVVAIVAVPAIAVAVVLRRLSR